MKKNQEDNKIVLKSFDESMEEYKNSISNLNQSIKDSVSGSQFASIEYLNKLFEKEGINDKTPGLMQWVSISDSTHKLKEEIKNLERRIIEKTDELKHKDQDIKGKTSEIINLTSIIDELNSKQRTQHLLNSVTERAHDTILENEAFRRKFSSEGEVKAFVVSVDIRRSTELMLKARTPKLFADFITNLCSKIEYIFKENWGVVDKFTGDGILAFFPIFFSGEDAGYYALDSATKSINAFKECYKEFRTSFSTILKDVGLGIGIDYGDVHFVQMAGNLTIVGQPVVYACRMGGAPANKIFINQPAFEEISKLYSAITIIEESSIDIKHEGGLLCYDAQLKSKTFEPKNPEWIK